MIAREGRKLVCAVQFLTRLPTPPLRDYEPGLVSRSARYFPLAGQLAGLAAAAVWLAAGVRLDAQLSALLAIGTGVLVSGGLHEDGLADTADGLGGGRDPARRLEIMKDSAIGVYGVLALLFSLGLRTGGLSALAPWEGALALLAVNGLSRAACVVAMTALPYAGDPLRAKEGAPGRPSARSLAIALLLAAWPLLFVRHGLWATLAGTACALVPALLARRLIGGRTGDVLGAVEQAFQVGFLLALAALA